MTLIIMKRILSLILLAAVVSITLVSCGADDPDPVPPASDKAPRTVLVYMQAYNSLGSVYDGNGFDDKDLREMCTAAAITGLGDARVIVYHQPRWNHGAASLLEVTPDGLVTLKDYDASELSVSETRMRRVIDDMRQVAPADRYGLVLWSHASGWWNEGVDGPEGRQTPAPRSFGIDSPTDDRRYTMSITSLADVLGDRTFDYIYFDCCFMASVEVAYQLRNVTGTIVASAAELPSNGMPYNLTLPMLVASEPDFTKIARTVFGHYDAAYVPYMSSAPRTDDSYGCTISVIDTSRLTGLATLLRAAYESGATLPADTRLQEFAPRTAPGNYCDLEDYINHLSGISHAEVTLLRQALHNAAPYQGATPGIDMINRFDISAHCGLSVYVGTLADPARRHNYQTLDWYRDVASASL